MLLKRASDLSESIKLGGKRIMVRFQVVSGLENGLDIKSAGEFVKEVIKGKGRVTIRNGEREGDAKLIFNVMSLNIKKGDLIEFSVEGEQELEEARSLKRYAREHL